MGEISKMKVKELITEPLTQDPELTVVYAISGGYAEEVDSLYTTYVLEDDWRVTNAGDEEGAAVLMLF